MSKFAIPESLLDSLNNVGVVMTIGDFIEMFRGDPDLVDYPVVDRKLGIVISKPSAHKFVVALLGVCHDVISRGGNIMETDEVFWLEENYKCGNLLYSAYAIDKFIRSGGYYFSSSRSYKRQTTLVSLTGRHMDEIDNEIIDRFSSSECYLID